MIRSPVGIALVALVSVAVAAGGASPAMADHSAGPPHSCGGMMPCEQQDRGPFVPLRCALATVACTAPALPGNPYFLGTSDADETAAPTLGLNLRTQRTTPVRTPPPRS